MHTENELYHHGVKGMKWGVRRFQNKNGSLTPAGRKHALSNSKEVKKGKSIGESARGYIAKEKRKSDLRVERRTKNGKRNEISAHARTAGRFAANQALFGLAASGISMVATPLVGVGVGTYLTYKNVAVTGYDTYQIHKKYK